MNKANITNDELNRRIREIQSRIAKFSGFQESQRQVIAQAKLQAIQIFGTDDPVEIKAKIEKIVERNAKVISFKTRALSLCEQVLGYVESNQPIPENLLQDLEKAVDNSAKHVPEKASVN